MEYKVIFEISTISIGGIGFTLAGTIFIIIGISLIRFTTEPIPKLFSYFFFTFSVLWTTISVSSIWSEHLSLRSNYEAKNYTITEGTIENFIHTNREKVENFTVNGVTFKYSNGVITSGYNQTNLFGGIIKEGLEVRISHTGNTILKLEIKKPSL